MLFSCEVAPVFSRSKFKTLGRLCKVLKLGAQLNITSDTLDKFFETNNYKELLPATEETEDNNTESEE